MKKSLFFVAAASALMLTACSSESDVVQNTTPTTQTTVQQQAVGFDLYTSAATNSRRAGSPEGVMTTDKLKTLNKGFGVFAMYTGTTDYAAGSFKPNFMFNEHIHWTSAGGWTYSPLKYWPNETTNDSQDPAATMPDLEKLSFFAYAPYVSTGSTGDLNTNGASDKITNSWHATETSGIMAIQDEAQVADPLVEWKYSTDIDKNVDLLWGVAAAGMDYTSVKGTQVPFTFGTPLLNLVKPNKDQKIKFLFQHALSRLGITVVSSIDQTAAGDDGDKFKNDQTRVLIEEVKIWGDFCTQGVLNLNNTTTGVNKANWVQTSISKSNTLETPGSPIYTFSSNGTPNAMITKSLRYNSADYNGDGVFDPTSVTTVAAATTKFNGLNEGVQTSETVLLTGGPDDGTKVTDPTFKFGTVLYEYNSTTKECKIAEAATNNTTSTKVYSKDANGDYTREYVGTGSGDGFKVDGSENNLVMLTGDGSGSTVAADLPISTEHPYWTWDDGAKKFTKVTTGTTTADTYYELAETDFIATYTSGNYWTGLLPRYMMFVPSKTDEPTKIKVQIKYHVVTFDEKLNGWVSNVGNDVTKQTEILLEGGKSYNLKLILGLTSVKLDAVVGEWQVGDDGEIWLPQNN